MLRSLDYYKVTIVVENNKGDKKVGAYTLEDLLNTTEADLVEELTRCDCEPIGECNYVECNCEDKWNDITINVET